MATCGIALSGAEWAEVAEALAEAERAPAQGTLGFGGRLASLLFGHRPAAQPDSRGETLRQFVRGAADCRRLVRDLAPPLARLGFSPPQIEAMALLSAPARARQVDGRIDG
jgi:hypothetical protein